MSAAFREAVLNVVRAVPQGKVTTYGEVALMVGMPNHARQVGAVLYGLKESDGDVPWQRVVNASGGISTYKVGSGELQVALLRSEGVEVVNDRVDLRRYRWEGPEQGPQPTWTELPR